MKKKAAVKANAVIDDCIFDQLPLLIPYREVDDNERQPPLVKTPVRLTDEEFSERLERMRTESNQLFILAENGDWRAINLILRTAGDHTESLEILARRNPELLHPVAKLNIKWPAFISRKKMVGKLNTWLIKRLKLAEDCPLNFKWEPESRATATAHHMIDWLEKNQTALSLPPLTKQTAMQWFELGWRALMKGTDGQPEKNPYLQKFVIKQAESELKRSDGYSAEDALEKIMQRRLKDAIKQGFKTLTSHHPEL